MSNPTKTLTTGSNLSELDIFLSANGQAINASGISFNVYDAADVLAVSGVPTNPAMGHYLSSGVVPDGFVLGVWRIDWLIIPTGAAQVIAAEEFNVQGLTVAFGFQPTDDKVFSIFDAVRLDLADSDARVFVDEYLSRILTKAVRRLNQTLGIGMRMRGPTGVEGQFGGRRIQVYPLVVDVEAGTISPNDDEMQDLLILQMEYIIKTSELTALKRLSATASSGPTNSATLSAINDDVLVRNADGVEVRMGTNRFATRAQLYKFDVEQMKAELDAATKRFLGRITGSFGKMIY